jgi:hypothetical protein
VGKDVTVQAFRVFDGAGRRVIVRRVCVLWWGGGGIGNRSVKDARAAVVKLHGATKFKGKSSGALWARQLGGEGALLKRWKLIVRNLSFKVTSLSPDRVNVL